MSEIRQLTAVVSDCIRYWRQTGVPRAAAEEMGVELAQHLEQAVAAGDTIHSVIGRDVAAFAESWAAEMRSGGTRYTWEDVITGRAQTRRQARREMIMYGAGAALVIAAVAVAAREGANVDTEIWRWLWTIFAIVMGIGEIFTAGFFLLPFAIGAAVAAILAWVGAAVLAQWLVFFGVSFFALAYLRRFITRQDEENQPRVGANRWVNARGVVLEAIDPMTGSGMVRVENEEWRAAAGTAIEAGRTVVVIDVRGARLFVEED